MKLIIAADHRGFKLKEALKARLVAAGHDVEDIGAHALDPEDDYPDFGYPAAQMVAAAPGAKGILVCGSGIGMDVVANKVKGVRATVISSIDGAIHASSRDGVNVITLGADTLTEDQAFDIVQAFLTTPLIQEEKYTRRLQKIALIEGEYLR
ncbi:hypothetical protein A2765_05525 [Candidatus Kaiserbacteria bacterium RIFCSPHIGHO2_01_FULL_56_24]|uniref:Ribose-5-phosphate isomerase n=1 Tax=Candidatus Kaiserbacteria bacterium RIFCSPHIGHO2_01_FULL_56_24 TaxID=1798487 RepID=A0A1F6DAK5_9BACT|nr:MAG: hypothetical protein A2765_05525 [Candidatus Kaiserbacteria bacterium RIFCSPHIGHO2_01_FULL_56_24]